MKKVEMFVDNVVRQKIQGNKKVHRYLAINFL